MDKIKTVKIKNPDGSISEETYTISVDARNVDMENSKNLQETIGTINVDIDGDIANQLKNEKEKVNIINTAIVKKPYYYNTIIDMKNDLELKEGDMAITLGYYDVNDGGAGEYKIVSGEYIDDGGSYHRLNNSLYAQLIIKNGYFNVKQFGAYGDGIHDDRRAIQNAINSPFCGVNLVLGEGTKAVFRIEGQLDLKGKGIIGNGFSKQNATFYNMNSLYFYPGDYSNTEEKYNNKALINVGADIRNLQLVASSEVSTANIDGIMCGGYNTTIDNINITGFYNQIYIDGITVSFRLSNLTSISSKNAGLYVFDRGNDQSTTCYVENCSWQWGGYGIIFDKEVYGSSFKDIVIEHMDGGFKAECFISCIFENIWTEGRKGSTEKKMWVETTSSQQLVRNLYNQLYIRDPWTNPANPKIAYSQNGGGVSLQNTSIGVADSTSNSGVYLDGEGLHSMRGEWAHGNLIIESQKKGASSQYTHGIVFKAEPKSFFFRSVEDNDFTPIELKRTIGKAKKENEEDPDTILYGIDKFTSTSKRWDTHENGSDTNGYFQAPMFLTYEAHKYQEGSTSTINNGWQLIKNGTEFIIQRADGCTKEFNWGHIAVSGIAAGNNIHGDLIPVIPAIQLIDAYGSSYSVYSVYKSFKIKFYNLQGEVVEPQRFTVIFTDTRL